MSDSRPVIAVVGATGSQGGGVVSAPHNRGTFRVRALTRNPDTYSGPADEVARADLNRPDTLPAAFSGAHGVFLVTNFWEPGTDEGAQGSAAVQAARQADVQHLVRSTLPDVEAISDGKYVVQHFTQKSRVDPIVREAGFPSYS
jgi:uncharacterized protein YbjT (DUF2867 family)